MGRNGTKLGQNFLVDEAACLLIPDALGDLHDRTVVEIGPGHGAITAHLAPRCARLHCLELDPHLARELTFRFRQSPEVTVHEADVLKTDFSALAPAAEDNAPSSPPPLDVIGNLPYYITSPILLHLFEAARAGLLRRAVVMMQREVADRLAATPGTTDYGSLTVLTQLHAAVSPLFTLPPSAFSPPPEVFSTVLRLDFAPQFDALALPWQAFNRFLRSAFAQKRKTLANNLRAVGHTPQQIAASWPAGLAPTVRAEAVPLDGLAALYRSLSAAGPG